MALADQALVMALLEIAIPTHIAPRAMTANRLVPNREMRVRATVRLVRSDLRAAASVATSGQI